MDPRQVIEAGEEAEVRPDDTPDEAKERVLEAMSRSLLHGARGADSLTPRSGGAHQVLMERDRRMANVLSYFAQWLQADGYDVRLEQRIGPDPVRTDVVAVRGTERILAELRPAIAALRESDARAIAARQPIAPEAAPARRLLVLASNTSVESAARQFLDVQGIEIYFVDPDSGRISRMDPASGQIEIVSPGPADLLR